MPKAKNSNNFDLYYEVLGNPDAEQTVIMAHGNGNCCDDWKSLGYINAFGDDYRVIVMDALGYGKSDKPHDSSKYYTSEARAADVVSVLKATKTAKAHFFGNSVGGSVGFVLAAKYPEYFQSFVIGSAHPYGSKELEGCNLYLSEFIEKMRKDGVEAFVTYVEEEFLHKKFPHAVRVNFVGNDVKAMELANIEVWPDYSSYLPQIKVPVLLFAGENDGVSQFLPAVDEKINDCEVYIFKGFDHADTYWSGAEVIGQVKQFLQKISQK